MTKILKLVRHDADQTISVYGPVPKGSFAGHRRPRRHLGMIFKPTSDHPDYACQTSVAPDRPVSFKTEAEAVEFFKTLA